MNILVCVKQVPATEELRIDPITHNLIRSGVPSILNPFDGYALEQALRIKDLNSSPVFVLTMGPTQTDAMLRDCLAIGADQACRVTDAAFVGSDTYVTSFILSRAISYLEHRHQLRFDLILCGKQAIDGDTAQVGPALAEQMSIPQITCATEITVLETGISVRRESVYEEETLRCSFPALLTVARTAFPLRYPTLRSTLASRKRELLVLSNEILNLPRQSCGLSGSPTTVFNTFVPHAQRVCRMIGFETDSQALTAVAQRLLQSDTDL